MDEKQLQDKLHFAGEKVPSMKRRSETHDYHGQRFYLITLAVEGRWAVLGHLVGRSDGAVGTTEAARVVLSPLGLAVAKAWSDVSRYYPQVAVIAQQVMPDHFHGILYVREHTAFHLGQVVKGFKLACNKTLRRLVEEAKAEGAVGGEVAMVSPRIRKGPTDAQPATSLAAGTEERTRLLSFAAIPSQPKGKAVLWEQGYNDRILHNYSTLEKWKIYLRDNPRRLAVRREHPDYFRVQFGVTVGTQTYAAIGNRFLLHHPEKEQVQLTRSLTEGEIANEVAGMLGKAMGGVVPVSPAISTGEQAVMRATMDAGLPLIFITPWGFNTFSKPGHQYYEACAEGRLLLLAPWPHENERRPLTRSMCLALNAMAAEIASL